MKGPRVWFLQFIITLIFCLFGFSEFQRIWLSPIEIRIFPELNSAFRELFNTEKKEEPPADNYAKKLDSGPGYRALKRFYEDLKELEAGREKTVRIIHYGDSIIWADMVTRRLKENFQKDFGDGGRGAVPLFSKLERTVYDHSTSASESAFVWKRVRPGGSPDARLGFLGESYLPAFPGAETVHSSGLSAKPWKNLELIFRQNGTLPQVTEIRADSEGKTETLKSDSKEKCFSMKFSLNSRKASVKFLSQFQNHPFVDAMIFETEKGVSISPVSTMGIEMRDLLTVDEENFKCGMKIFRPRLVIFQFGVNESQNLWQSSTRDEKYYKTWVKKTVQRYKKELPDTDILIISPMERIRKNEYGVYITMPEMMKIRKIHREIAEEDGIAFFDSLNAFGGTGKSRELFDKGIIQEDRTHMTRQGSEYFADLLYDEIYREYRNYQGYLTDLETKRVQNSWKENRKIVNFNSAEYYIFLIFLSVLILFGRLSPSLKTLFLTAASILFYASWQIWPVGILIFSAALDYILSRKMEETDVRGRKKYLILSVCMNLGLLAFFKYTNFFMENIGNALSYAGYKNFLKPIDILLPAGISFYTFQTMSYTIDVYRGIIPAEKSFLRFCFYVSFFPQLVAGPIVRAKEFLPQINTFFRHFAVTEFKLAEGVFLILVGLSKKLAADWIGSNIVNPVYSNPELFSSAETWTAVYAYGVQIYGDFSGYTDIAIGSAMLLGFHLTVNFNSPYISCSVSEFWRRWHMSLGSWLRDYLYIPLGGSRERVYRNLILTMFLCGLWHGAGWNFILWGLYNGLLMAFERLVYKDGQKKYKFSFFRWLLTFHLIIFGWIVFRSENMTQFMKIWNGLFAGRSDFVNVPMYSVGIIIIIYLLQFIPEKTQNRISRFWTELPAMISAFAVSVFIVL
ncbi:MAG TPA: MBOAT family O-acyltransferase, partial [Leptospiraceae bacterium]|nr:MBOAT family O-acyltransferase [Leptospiraceae bacterium]